MKDQVHNNASYANQIWQYYQFTQDLDMLREFYPILEGLARFFISNVIEITPRGYETREVVGVHESPVRVRNEGITLTGSIAILRHTLDAAGLLGIQSDFLNECQTAADGLEITLQRLYNGRYFVSAEGAQGINMSSIAPIYPMQIVSPEDERAQGTVNAYLDNYRGRMVGHGNSRSGFPWSAGVLATVIALQGQGDLAWQVIQSTRPAICVFGGMTEVMENDTWNMQYFGTAQGAVCTALHHLLLQSRGAEIRLFPALPSTWVNCSFDRLLASGCEVSATWDRNKGTIDGVIKNISQVLLSRKLTWKDRTETITLEAGETHAFHRS
jgi:alpha-L-fucosidase 2